MISAKPGASEKVYKQLCGYEEVTEIYWTAGPANFVCIVRVKNMTDLSRFMTTNIESLEDVEKVDTIFIMPGPEECPE